MVGHGGLGQTEGFGQVDTHASPPSWTAIIDSNRNRNRNRAGSAIAFNVRDR